MEFDLIARVRARAATRGDVLLGIGDDGAIVRVPPDRDLVIVTDTLNTGVHFPAETAPADIGWKALAVNLSDLAAMGAQPAWCTLSLSLPDANFAWLDAFLDGFAELASRHGVALIGGDTTRGPLSITVTAHGLLPRDTALRRDTAVAGDDLWVTGTLGDAAGALAQWKAGATIDAALRARLDRPTPRVETGLALAGLASACIDVSDGLLADLGHILEASKVGATLDASLLPASRELAGAFDARTMRALQLAGGDDYELCFTAPPARRAHIEPLARRIGRIDVNAGLRVIDEAGHPIDTTTTGWDHFHGATR